MNLDSSQRKERSLLRWGGTESLWQGLYQAAIRKYDELLKTETDLAWPRLKVVLFFNTILQGIVKGKGRKTEERGWKTI